MAPMVSLPSIHEGFPDVDFRDPPLPGSYPLTRGPSKPEFEAHSPSFMHRVRPRRSHSSSGPYDRPVYYAPPPREALSSLHERPANSYHHRDNLTYSPSRRLSYPSPRAKHASQPTSMSPPPPPFTLHRVDPRAAPDFGDFGLPRSHSRPRLSSGTSHSFDVLRSDPGTVSLEHLASSKTLQNRGNAPPRPISPNGIANGSAPAFRVVLPDPASGRTARAEPPLDSMSDISQRRSAVPVVAESLERRPTENPRMDTSESSEYPSMVSFSMSDGSKVSKLTVDDNGRSHFEDVGSSNFRTDGRGKKHQCPQCSKRFNRPSSLRIHVNTHTGARPFQCPYPNCGREFNVNSNMRRHYRNHSVAATAEVHPPRHNSGRRPHGYPRPHPGQMSTSIFHVEGRSSRSDLSNGSPSSSSLALSEDDYDMERRSEEYDSGFDEGAEDEGGGDEYEGGIQYRRRSFPSWSRSSSPSLDRSQPREHVYSHPRPAAQSRTPPVVQSQSPSSVPRRFAGAHSTPSSSSSTYASAQSRRDSTVSTTLRPAFR